MTRNYNENILGVNIANLSKFLIHSITTKSIEGVCVSVCVCVDLDKLILKYKWHCNGLRRANMIPDYLDVDGQS